MRSPFDPATKIDLAAILERFPDFATMRCVDVATLIEISRDLTMVADRNRFRDARDRCHCQMAMVVFRGSDLSLQYPGMPVLSAMVPDTEKAVEHSRFVCRKCGYVYPSFEILGMGFHQLPTPKKIRKVRFPGRAK